MGVAVVEGVTVGIAVAAATGVAGDVALSVGRSVDVAIEVEVAVTSDDTATVCVPIAVDARGKVGVAVSVSVSEEWVGSTVAVSTVVGKSVAVVSSPCTTVPSLACTMGVVISLVDESAVLTRVVGVAVPGNESATSALGA